MISTSIGRRTPAARDVEAGVDGQAMEPGIEPVGVAQARQVSPCPEERLLDRVARELRVPEDEPGRRVQPREGQVDERGEGVMIALPRSLDETSLVHGRLGCGTAPVVVLTGYGAWPASTVQSGVRRPWAEPMVRAACHRPLRCHQRSSGENGSAEIESSATPRSTAGHRLVLRIGHSLIPIDPGPMK